MKKTKARKAMGGREEGGRFVKEEMGRMRREKEEPTRWDVRASREVVGGEERRRRDRRKEERKGRWSQDEGKRFARKA